MKSWASTQTGVAGGLVCKYVAGGVEGRHFLSQTGLIVSLVVDEEANADFDAKWTTDTVPASPRYTPCTRPEALAIMITQRQNSKKAAAVLFWVQRGTHPSLKGTFRVNVLMGPLSASNIRSSITKK